MGKAPERKEKGKETLQSLINTKRNKNKSLEHLLQALDGRIRLKLSAFPVWVYVWRRPVWPLPTRKKLFTFPNLGCACNWFLFVSIAEMKIQRGEKKPHLDTIEFRSFSSPEWKLNSQKSCVKQSVLFLLKCQYMQYLWGKLWKCRAQFIKHNCTRQKCHPFMQVIPDLGNIFSMKKTSYPSFQFQGAWLLDCTLLSSQVFLCAVLDGLSLSVSRLSHWQRSSLEQYCRLPWDGSPAPLPVVLSCFVRAGLLSVQAAGTEAWRMLDIEQSL